MTEQQLSCKRFLASAGVGVAGLALPGVARAAPVHKLPVFRLNPDAGICDGPSAACACNAC